MKKLLLLICLLPALAFGQNTNGTLQRQIASPNIVRGLFGSTADTIPVITGTATNGYILVYNSTKKKWDIVSSSTIVPTLSVGTVSPGGYANGLNYAAGTFRLGKVSATNPGVLTTGTDTIAGAKRFEGIPTFNAGAIVGSGGLLVNGNITAQGLGVTTSSGANSIVFASPDNGTSLSVRRFSNSFSAVQNFLSAGSGKWDVGLRPSSENYVIRNLSTSTDALTIDNTTNALTLSSLTTGSVYSSSGTLTNTAPTSGTIGYWSRNSGTSTLTGATANDNVDLGTGDMSANRVYPATALILGSNPASDGSIRFGNGLAMKWRNAANSANKQLYLSSSDVLTTDAPVSVGVSSGSPISLDYSGVVSGQSPASSGTTPVNPVGQFTTNRGTGLFVGGQFSSPFGMWMQVSDKTDLSINYPLLLNPNGGAVNVGSLTASQLVATDGSKNLVSVTALPSGTTAVTQSPNDNSTKVATTAYVDAATGGGLTFASGTYTPTFSAGSNATSITANEITYQRIGSIVSVSGSVSFTVTTGSVSTSFEMTLPVASNFSLAQQAHGNGSSTQGVNVAPQVYANETTNLAVIAFNPASNGSTTINFNYQYRIL